MQRLAEVLESSELEDASSDTQRQAEAEVEAETTTWQHRVAESIMPLCM